MGAARATTSVASAVFIGLKKHPQCLAAKKHCGIIEKAMPIHQSNVAIFNAATGKADRVGVKLQADGKRVRVYKSSGEEIKVA